MKKAMLVVGVSLVLLVGVAWAGGLVFEFGGQEPSTVIVKRTCYPGTADAVYVSHATDATGASLDTEMVVVPGGCGPQRLAGTSR